MTRIKVQLISCAIVFSFLLFFSVTSFTTAQLEDMLGVELTGAQLLAGSGALPDYQTTSFYLEMPDKVQVAVDARVPKKLPESGKIPAIIMQTRTWRSRDMAEPQDKTALYFLQNGYAFVTVDVRGTGASTGTWPYAWSAREIKDGTFVVDWIIKQPWSNGKVGTFGDGYSAVIAEFLVIERHPAVKAAVLRYSPFDIYTDLAFPGGVQQVWFPESWSKLNKAFDAEDPAAVYRLMGRDPGEQKIPGVKPVDADQDRSLLSAAIADHQGNGDVLSIFKAIQYSDDSASTEFGALNVIGPYYYLAEIAKSGVPIYCYTGWFDAAYVRGEINRYLSIPNPKKLTIGPWPSGGRQNISPWAASAAVGFDHDAEMRRFFDYYLKGIDTRVMSEEPIHYYTMGEEKWKAAATWPLPNQVLIKYFLAEGHKLTEQPSRQESGFDTYQVDFSAGSGNAARWNSLFGAFDVLSGYHDRRVADQKLLVYESAGLEQDTEVTGHPGADLFVSSTDIDGSFFVYLEDVDPAGKVSYITEGLLQAVCRKVSEAEPIYAVPGPYHTFKRTDMESMVPGQVTELRFDLLPTSVLFKKGHRIRIAIAGADKDHFGTPMGIPPTVQIMRDSTHQSSIELPVIPRGKK